MAQVHSVKGFALVDFDGGEFNWVVSLLVPPFVWLSAVLILCSFAGKVLNSSPGNLGPTQPRSHFRTFSLISCFSILWYQSICRKGLLLAPVNQLLTGTRRQRRRLLKAPKSLSEVVLDSVGQTPLKTRPSRQLVLEWEGLLLAPQWTTPTRTLTS